MSGSTGFATTREANQRFTTEIAQRFNVSPTVHGIASIPLDALLGLTLEQGVRGAPSAAAAASMLGRQGGLCLQPVPDGDLIPGPVHDILRSQGPSDNVALLIGATESEFEFEFERFIDTTDDSTLETAARLLGLGEPGLLAYRTAHPQLPDAMLIGHLATDRTFRIPALRLAEARAARPAAYLYDFRWRSTSKRFPHLGAGHCVDVPFAFDLLAAPGVSEVLGDNPPDSLAEVMHRAWVEFIYYGHPGWPRYDRDQRLTMIYCEASRVESDPLRFERSVWHSDT
jgi:para-nitrobenzyl esterase